MKNYKLTFPKFKDILNLESNKKYSFTLFKFYHGYCRILWNEENYGKLYLDIILNGYVEDDYVFERTKEDYDNLKKKANDIYNKMVEDLLDIKNEWNNTNIENGYVCSYLDEL